MPNTLKMFKNITILYMNSIFEYTKIEFKY